MTNDDAAADRLAKRVRAALDDNAVFLGYADDTRYWIPHEAVEALAYLITAVVLPILTNLASHEIIQRRPRHLETEARPPELANGAVEIYRREITEIVTVQSAAEPSRSAITEAEEATAEILTERGWPSNLAATDAGVIVAEVREHLAS
jgi:hypothetical protein